MNFKLQSIRRVLVGFLVMAVCASAFGGVTTVTLRATVRVSGDESLTLGQVSSIDGDQADALGGLVIEELLSDKGEGGQRGGWQKLDVEELRELLMLESRVHAGSVIIEGKSVSVRRVERSTAKVEETLRAKDRQEKVGVSAGPVVRDHVSKWVRDRYRIGNGQFRMSFRSGDNAFLKLLTGGRLVEIQEISRRGRSSVRVTVYDNEQIVGEQSLIFDVTMYKSVLVARARVNRGVILEETHFMRESRWVSPDDHAASAQEALGMAISKTINPGQLLQSQHIELPLVIRRGDIVSAKSIAGSVAVSVRGRAKGDARIGEIVEIESMSGEAHFSARATGKRTALIVRDIPANGASR